jgi:FAD/FMN-containing dehydrogenase
MLAAELPTGLARELTNAVGGAHVLTDPEITAGFATDWTGRFRGHSPAVVRPGTTAQVAAVVSACARAGVAVVPQGGNTGLVGGGVPLRGEVVLSLVRLQDLGAVDVAAAQVTAGAGVTLARLQAHVAPHALAFGVDLAPRDSCTVGGMIATNAGGMHVVRYGTTRAQLMGIEAVLGDGRVVSHLGGLVKDNTGYDLAGLLTGSEGTLGVVTAARLRLVPLPRERATAAFGFERWTDAVDAVAVLRARVPGLEAVEVMVRAGVELVAGHHGWLPPPALLAPVSLLVDAIGEEDPLQELARAAGELTLVAEPAVATTPDQRQRLWAIREGHAEAINQLGAPLKLDVSVPAAAIAAFVAALPGLLPAGARLDLFGHLGDGNLHVNLTGIEGSPEPIEAAVLSAVVGAGGSISAEHGIGTAKAPYLHLCRTPAEIATFRAIKAALDPVGIMNPNAVLPPP